jgi:hypothetical protein
MGIFVGNDTQSFEYSFLGKIANSTTECPLKIYEMDIDLANPPSPSDAGWMEIINQTDLNKLWFQDSANYLNKTTITSNRCKALLVEVNLSTICTTLFNGNNASLKSAIKSMSIDAWVQGSGINSGAITNGITVKLWYEDGSTWANYANNIISSIAKVSIIPSLAQCPNRITTSNKIYILLTSMYPSDGTVPSIANLDYINVKISFTRTADIINPVVINLPQYWSILIKDFIPNWDYAVDRGGSYSCLLTIKDNDIPTDNRITLWYYDFLDKFSLFSVDKLGITESNVNSSVQSFKRFQITNFLLENTPKGLRMRILNNNGTIEKQVSFTSSTLYGDLSLYIGKDGSSTTYNANAFFDEIVIFNKNFDDDTEAENLLRGNTIYGYDELILNNNFSNGLTNWLTAGVPSVKDGKLCLDKQMSAYQTINCLPNNKYRINVTKDLIDGGVKVEYYWNTALISSDTFNNSASISNTFITPNYCNKVKITVYNDDSSVNQIKVSNVSLKIEM